jgi:hypothetical protein
MEVAAMKSAVTLAMVGILGFTVSAAAGDKPGGDSPKSGNAVPRGDSGSKSGSSASSSSSDSKRTPSSSEIRHEKQEKAERQPTAAQLRHPRAGTGRGDHRDREWRHGYHNYRPYNRYYYGYDSSYWAPYYYGYGYYGPSYYGYYGYPASRGYRREAGALRLRVEPEQTRVFVDGYYAGEVDDFDGVFQRLYLAPGRHDITLRLDGHRSHRFRVYVPIDQTLKLHHRMVAGEGEDTADFGGDAEDEGEVRGRPAGVSRLQDDDDDERTDSSASPALEVENWGTLRFDIQPNDASIYVDGEFRGTAREARSLKLPAGMHKVEVVRPGFATVDKDVEVKPDETSDFEAELEKS